MSHADYTQWEARIWVAINECTLSYSTKILTGDSSQCLNIGPNQRMLLQDALVSATMRQILAKISVTSPSSATVYVSSALVSVHLWSPAQCQTASQTSSHTREKYSYWHVKAKQLILQFWLQKRETLLLKKKKKKFTNKLTLEKT